MKQAKAMAYLRQLCCSGLPKEIVVPEFLRAVQAVIPSGNNTFTGVDDHFSPSYLLLNYSPNNIEELAVFIRDFFSAERMLRGQKWLLNHKAIPDPRVFDEAFYRSDIYHLIYLPYDQHYGLGAPVINYGTMLGMVVLFRSRNQKPFDNHDEELLSLMMPYIAHAMTSTVQTDIPFETNGSSGMLVMDLEGKVIYLDNKSERLMILANHPVVDLYNQVDKKTLTGKLVQLRSNLISIFQGKGAPPPTFTHDNARGRFIFRGYWLSKLNQEPGGLIGITIEHQEPLLLKILRGLEHAPLSSMQKEVASLLAQGFGNEQICQQLHIKPSTVKDHVKKIFTKLDIHKREELLSKLMTLSNQTTQWQSFN